jgi:hypothetical protein
MGVVYGASAPAPSGPPQGKSSSSSYGPAPIQQSQPIQQQLNPPVTTPTVTPPTATGAVPPAQGLPPKQSSLSLQLNPSTIYSEPGIVTLQGGEWVGNEHLYNLSSSLGVVVDLIKPAGASIALTESALKEKVVAAFKRGHITERNPMISGRTPLPFFHLIVIIQPIEKGYVAYVVGRLFEEAQMKRVELKPNISWQAITWERQELIVFPTEQLQSQIDEAVLSIVNGFVERFNSYPPAGRN